MTTKPKLRAARAEPVAAPMPDPVMELVARLPDLWAKILRLDDISSRIPNEDAKVLASGRCDAVSSEKEAINTQISYAEATTLDGALAQLVLAICEANFIEATEGDHTEEAQTIQRLVFSAIAGIQAATGVRLAAVFEQHYVSDECNPFRKAKEAARGGLERAGEPDPIIALVRRAREARERYCDESALSDEETEAFDEAVFKPAEDALTAAKPTTLEGVAAILDLAVEALERDASHLYRPLFETARDAMQGTPLPALSPEPDPVMALVRRFEEAKAGRDGKDESDKETEAFVGDVILPFHDNLAKAVPTTRDGVCAIINVAIEELVGCPGRGAGDYRFALLENALAALKAGVA